MMCDEAGVHHVVDTGQGVVFGGGTRAESAVGRQDGMVN
jgi:hypothetical protein